METCDVCGDDLRRYCSQGHVTGVGELFCDACGELLPLSAEQDAMTPGAPPALDYSSGSFADFIADSAVDPARTYGFVPAGPGPAVAVADLAVADVAVADVHMPADVLAPVAPADLVPGPRPAGPEPGTDF